LTIGQRRSYSGVHGNCVEVAAPRKQCPSIGDPAFLVRDSQDPAGPVLEAGAAAWRAFLAGIKGS
jgi:Domain of unknown function (DUF397)